VQFQEEREEIQFVRNCSELRHYKSIHILKWVCFVVPAIHPKRGCFYMVIVIKARLEFRRHSHRPLMFYDNNQHISWLCERTSRASVVGGLCSDFAA
jgi:hypothetical protein